MSAYVAKKVGRRIAGNRLAGQEVADPHFEEYTDHKGRKRQRKRPMPPGLSKRDEKILRAVRRRAHYLDKGFSLCGFRFGWTAILGLIPGAGDIAQFLLGYTLVLRKCRDAEIPAALQSRMMFNQLAGLGIGLIPLLGDIALAVFKANSRNAALLEEFLVRRANTNPVAASTSNSPGASTDALAPNANAGAHETDERAAQNAIATARIDRATGDLRERGQAPAAAGAGAQDEGSLAAARAAEERETKGKKGWYGWGGGGGGAPAPATTTTATAPGSSTTVKR